MNSFFFILNYIEVSIDNNFYLTFFIFFTFLLIYNIFSIPGNLIFIASTGYFFGILLGFLISITSIVLGSLIFFLYASFILKKYLPNLFYKFSKKINNYISNSSFEYLIMLRIIPGPPLILQNLILSTLNVKKFNFITSSFIGFSPIILVVVFFGNQLTNFDKLKDFSLKNVFSLEFLIFIILIFFILLVRILYKKNKIKI